MAKIKSIDLTSGQRCQMILFKSECRTSKEVAKQLGCCEVVVNSWMKRYQEQGFDGLNTKAGQERDKADCPSSTKKPTWLRCVMRCSKTASACLLPKRN